MARGQTWGGDGNGLCLANPESDPFKYRLDLNIRPFLVYLDLILPQPSWIIVYERKKNTNPEFDLVQNRPAPIWVGTD